MYFQKLLKSQACLTVVFSLFFTVILLPTLTSQTVHTFNNNGGDGLWSTAENWASGMVPNNPLPSGEEIVIAENATLNVNNVEISNGAKLSIQGGASLVTGIPGSDPDLKFFTNNGTLTNNGSFTNDVNMTNNGSIVNTTGSEFQLAAESFENEGDFLNQGNLLSEGDFNNNGSLINSSTGIITHGNDPDDAFVSTGAFNNNGSFIRGVEGTFAQTGATAELSGEGSFNFESGSELNIQGGTITPGNSFGTMSISGNITFAPGVTIFIEIVGGPSSNNDAINATGAVDLGGCDLIVVRTDGLFNSSDSWTIISGTTSVTDTFSNATLPVHSGYPSPPLLADTFSLSINTNDVTVAYAGSLFLPIELASFSGQVVDQGIQLDWVTETETNNHYFLVERSGDGLSYEEIGRVSGQGTTVEAQAYRFVDAEPLGGVNYYRLRQVDLDGQDELSKVITVNMDDNNTGLRLKAFPNPAQENISLQWFSSQTSEEGLIRLIDAGSGREVRRYAIPNGNSQMEIPVSQLPAGHYFFQMEQQGERQTVRFVKK